MSNEYKDWLRDTAANYLLDCRLAKSIEYCEPMQGGYIAICEGFDWERHVFFVWDDDLEGWSYREIYV